MEFLDVKFRSHICLLPAVVTVHNELWKKVHFGRTICTLFASKSEINIFWKTFEWRVSEGNPDPEWATIFCHLLVVWFYDSYWWLAILSLKQHRNRILEQDLVVVDWCWLKKLVCRNQGLETLRYLGDSIVFYV